MARFAGFSRHQMVAITVRLLLFAAGAITVVVGLDNALGGLATMGWQHPQDFVVVTDSEIYAIRDSHVRFLGGVWAGAGLVMLQAALFPTFTVGNMTIIAALGLAGGLARFSAGGTETAFVPELQPALVAEFLILPVLALMNWATTSWVRGQ